jgi:hypothetical protein
MKIEKLFRKLHAFFDPDTHKKKQHIEELKKILLKLKKKERKIAHDLELADDGALIEHYRTELKIIKAQRTKGIEVLQQLKKHKKAD